MQGSTLRGAKSLMNGGSRSMSRVMRLAQSSIGSVRATWARQSSVMAMSASSPMKRAKSSLISTHETGRTSASNKHGSGCTPRPPSVRLSCGGWARCAPPSSVAATVEHRPADMLWHRRSNALLKGRGARRELHRAVRLLRSSGFVLAACDAFAAIIEKGRWSAEPRAARRLAGYGAAACSPGSISPSWIICA